SVGRPGSHDPLGLQQPSPRTLTDGSANQKCVKKASKFVIDPRESDDRGQVSFSPISDSSPDPGRASVVSSMGGSRALEVMPSFPMVSTPRSSLRKVCLDRIEGSWDTTLSNQIIAGLLANPGPWRAIDITGHLMN